MNRVPMRWPASPPEHWSTPESLSILSGAPVNCLILPHESAVASRAAAMGFEVIPSGGTPQPQGVITVEKAVWPSARGLGRGDGTSAGPTGNAWVDSNGWRIRLTRERSPGRELWLDYAPPAKQDVSAEAYIMAVADAAAYGGRWIISLDQALAGGLARGSPQANETWKRLMAAVAFFKEHAAWSSFPAVANLGVLSDFSSPNEALAGEVLNLAARQHQLYRVLLMEKAAFDSYKDLRAVVYPDHAAPSEPIAKKLAAYVEAGGLLVGPPALKRIVPQSAMQAEPYPRHDIFRYGKGRFAISARHPSDPYLLASDAQLILSRRHDPLRVWNGGSMNVHVTAAPGGRQTIVQFLNYALRTAGHEPSFQLANEYRTARLIQVDPAAATPIEPVRAPMGTEIHLPGIPVYAAVELTK